MGAGLPVLSAREVERILLALGFVRRPGKGAHRFFRHADGRTTTVPFHAGRDIRSFLLHKICADIGLSIADFIGSR
ncbi:type II toxin-antitoxin system HicA family toxin [Roseateles sp. L2-2]|uniref:type II toxin-antitoxin system HicA family toxin n=1 Tax=Roseateles sp. L2-2 TaxID=3422597 RepID=UPI003D36FADB